MTNVQTAIIAAALLLTGCGGLTSAEPEQPAEASEVAEVIEEVAPAPEPQPNYYQESLDLGYEAAVAAGTAKTWREWDQVAGKWIAALQTMQSVPEKDANYAQAQAKAQEYGANRDAAFSQRDKLPSESTFKPAAQAKEEELDEFRAKLSAIDPSGQIITGVAKSEPPLDCDTCIDIGVSTMFLSQNNAVRLELATNLWEGWAVASSPNDPDEARIRLVTSSGTRVGGSTMWGGSDIYVDD